MPIDSFFSKRIFGFIYRLLQPDVVAIGVLTVLYGIIIWSLNRGVSIDEGYYLLGYLPDQPIKYALTDFHNIVKSIFFFLPEDAALSLRIIRVCFTLLALVLFTQSSYLWLKNNYSVKFNRLLYFSLSFLAGSMCFAYASPVLYYDNIQLIIYLFSFALLFRIMEKELVLKTIARALILGILILFALTNYLPAGVFLLLISAVLIIGSQSVRKKGYLSFIFVLLGLGLGAILYSIFINSILSVGQGILSIYNSATKFESTKYETTGQLIVVLKYLSDLLLTLIPVILVIIVHYFTRKAIPGFRYMIDGILIIAYSLLVYKLSIYFSNILVFPILFILLGLLFDNRGKLKTLYRKHKSIVFLILLFTPLLAVLGSNQLLARKMFYYMPFWFLALSVLYAEYEIPLNKSLYRLSNYLFIITISIAFVFQGFLRHPHYNYSIRKSKYIIENAVRFKHIKVSEYQSNFYENGIRALNNSGFVPGDNVLAFYETYMLVYAAGGYSPDGLTYWAYNFVSDPNNIPAEKVNFIIIDEQETEMMSEFLAQTDWNFPSGYSKTVLGTDGQNLTNMGYNYILFSAKPSETNNH